MSGRHKPEVVRRVRRGRSAPDSKPKTDSGCFVDEELERNGSSDSSSGSLNSSPSREENQNLGVQIKESAEKNCKATGVQESPGKLQDGNSFEKGAMSKEETSLSNSEVKANDAVNKESDHAGDVVEKAKQASDFYCLYYSASPEGTLTRCDKNKLKSKPPVPPKPKQRRGSAPPSSFSSSENVQWRNREAKKHLFNDNDRPKSDTIFRLFQESEKKASVGERVLYFETFVSRKEFVNEQSSSNMSTDAKICDGQVAEQEKSFNNSHGYAPLVEGEDSLCELTESFNSLNMTNCTSLPGNVAVNTRESFLKPADTCSPLTCNLKNTPNSHEKTVPLVSPEESFTEAEDSGDSSNGTSLLMDTVPLAHPEQSLIDDFRSLSQQGLGKITEICGKRDYSCMDTQDLGGAEDDQGIVVVAENKDGKHCPSSFDKIAYHSNGAEEGLPKEECKSQAVSGLFFESKECSFEESDSTRLELSSEVSSASGWCHSWLSYSDSTGQQNNSREHILNGNLDETKQDLANNAHSYKTDNQFQPRSICSLPQLEKKDSAQLKRRSWSACDTKPKAVDAPFVSKVHHIPSSKLTTSMWQSADSLASPFVGTLHQNKARQNSSPDVAGLSSKKTACRKGALSHVERQDPSGYVSDDSSVHSEPLFQPLKKKSHNVLNSANFFRSVSDESVTSGHSCTETDTSSLSKASRKRFRHSIESRDPMRALRRQSMEFVEEQEFPSFRPISPFEAPRVQTLKRSNSNASSSSDSEVERIFKQAETPNSICSPRITGGSHDAIVTAVNNHKVTAMEALFGPQSQRNSTPVPDSCTSRLTTLSERFSEVQLEASTDGFEESLGMEEFLDGKENELRGGDEPGLEFDDTDYSEFYTLCEDKESLISAEALSVKKLLQSPQTVLPDPDIESVVLSATERIVFSPNSAEHKEKGSSQAVSSSLALDQILVDELLAEETSAEIEAIVQLEKRSRGTQTPPPAVLRVLSPSPSVGTQTSPVSLPQDPSASVVRRPYIPSNSSTKGLSPPPSQSCKPHAVAPDYFRTLPSSVDSFFSPTLPPPLQDNNKAISVEELLQILANMPVGEQVETPPAPRRRLSIQRYNRSVQQDTIAATDTVPRSLPSSWQHLHHSEEKQDGNTRLRSSTHLQRSAKSHDCIRQSLKEKESKVGVIQAKMVGCTESSENIRRKLRDWKLRSRLFEEEVECMEDKDAKSRRTQIAKERALKVSYDGSESTDSIETQSKLTRTHSLKRPRKDRAFSQKETEESNDKIGSCLATSDMMQSSEGQELHPGDTLLNDSNDNCSETGETSFNVTSDSILAANFRDKNEASDTTEVGTPGGISVFIDYRKKNGMHIMCTSTPKPTPEPDHCFFDRDGGVGYVAVDKADKLQVEKPVGSSTVDDIQAEVESQGDASSSSYSSDDDPFGEFGGSTETVVFVDTEPSIDISVTPDESVGDSLDLKLEKTPDTPQPLVKDGAFLDDNASLDALLGEARKSLNMEYLDTDILDKAIERFKQKVSPKSQNKTKPSGLSMEAYVALHQADELQGIISEIKGELKLLQDENVMLREQVESLANHQTAGEVTENSSTESSERLEHTYRLPNHKHGDGKDDGPVEVDVFLRGFSTAPLHHMPSKKRDILLGTVSVEGADWNGVIEAARKTFVEHISRIDPDNYLCLGAHSIQGVQTGVIVWSPGSLKRQSPRVSLSEKGNPCTLQLKDGSHFSCDSLVYETLLPKEIIEKYVEELLENRCVVLCGQQGLGKSYLAARLAEHIVHRIGWKRTPSVVTYNVAQKTRKELKEKLNTLLQCNISSPKEGTPAVIVLDQLNCLASLADIFELSQLQENKTCPYIIGVRDKSRKGPFSSKELTLCQYFRWLRVSVHDRQYAGLLGRFLRRKLSWSQAQFQEELGELLSLFDWLSKLLYHLNELLEEFCEPDSVIGPSLFYSCPMDFKAAEGWFGTVWNYIIIPYLHQSLRAGRKIFSRYICWEDPTKWVVLRYPWNKDQSRILPTLRKLRQVDIVLNRNQLGSDNISFAECIEDNERILRAQSTMSKRVRTVVQEKIPKGQLNAKRRLSKERESHRYYDDKDSCYSDTDSYLETSI